jgi:dipeptidyl aminopeptidase/acylaminoacyl peptidase
VEGDSAVLVYDRYDIWKVPADGSAPVRLTSGREKGLTYRVEYLWERGETEFRHIGLKDNVILSVFDNATKENGVATLNLAQPAKSFKTLVMGGYTWDDIKKARKADVFLYRKGNFRDPMDLYVASVIGKNDKKLTAINPQIADYNWGTVELYKWTAFDGTPLEGLLYKPEDFSPEKKYPVICYFYEKDSETLYSHIQVQPMWSIINIPFFVSRGYVVFVPDIVYRSGIPGESAYNCIVSGAQSLWQFPWIDKDNMAIQGQSWGGYQVAYLITRTSMFKAAGAGAPVSNMTSAYGGIRWESGMSRQFQYEQTQSRVGRDLWNGIELYMENSPLFKLPNVTTPVLIMHNDNDGAVPWYQGIELFMGLRRLGKPAWLLEYNDEAHNLRQRRNRKDLSIRLQQFFDYYLKGEPEPAWMKDGVPTAKKGYYFGYEY